MKDPENIYSLAFRHGQGAIAIMRLDDWRIIEVNESAVRLFGYEQEEIIGRTVFELNLPVNPERAGKILGGLKLDSHLQNVEGKFRRKNGDIVHGLLSATTISLNGEKCILAEITDATDRVEAEKALREARGFLETILNHLPNQVFWKNRDLEYLGCNKLFADVIGLDNPEDVVGKTDYEFNCDTKHVGKYREWDRKIIESGTPVFNLEESYDSADGTEGTVLTSKVPLPDDDGNIIGLLGICTDITERKKAEEALRKSEQTLARAQQVANIGSWEWNVADNTVIWSEQTCRIYGLDPACREVELATYMKIVHPEDLELVRTKIEEAVTGRTSVNTEHRILLSDGTLRYVHQVGEFFTAKHGALIHMTGTVQDITERTLIENERRKIETRYRDVVESANNVIVRWNCKGIITYMNPYGLKFFGYSEDELIGTTMFGTIVPEVETGTERDLEVLMNDILNNPDKYIENENENIRKNGERVWMAWSNRSVIDDDQFVEILSIGADITKRKQLEEKLDRMSRTDALTGLANRREFDEILTEEINRALRNEQPLSLLMLDIDFFKRYNDTYGHQAGDSCLKDIAGVLKESTKRAGELAARYGGEEFAVILPATASEDAFLVAEHIRYAVTGLEITHDASSTAPYLTISAGVTTCIPEIGMTPDEIIKQADDALYRAKENGRNGIVID